MVAYVKRGYERERERTREREGDETFMRYRAGVGNHNENAKIELFSRTEGRVMRVEEPGGTCVRGGETGERPWELRASECEEGRGKGFIAQILIPVFLSFSHPLYCLPSLISSYLYSLLVSFFTPLI